MSVPTISTPYRQIVFVGSSIMEGWANLPQFFPDTSILNTAIAGAQTHEIYARLDELVIPYAPKIVCYYCGSNDINSGVTPETIIENIRQTYDTLRQRLPEVLFLCMAIIKAPQKIERWDVVDDVNYQLAALAMQQFGFYYLDINPVFFNAEGQPRIDFYIEDQLHLTPQAYQALGEFAAPRIKAIFKELTLTIIPKPAKIIPGEGAFTLTRATCVHVSPEAIEVGQYLQDLLPLSECLDQPLDDAPVTGGIVLSTAGADPSLGAEGYQLTVSPVGVVIRANQPAGLFYGVQTLRQIFSPEGKIPSVEIIDRPRFPWRGMMLDVGRHLFPLDFIFRLIDTLALHKLNVLHWHLTEDQGWRIEIKKYPKLTEIGAHRSASPLPTNRDRLDDVPYGGFYTQEQVRQVVAYAASRFITVVPEIEMPGHSAAALASYPELGCTGGPYAVRNFWGIENDVYCAGNEQTFTFLQDVLNEVLALFPSPLIHIGGDECPKVRWEKCPKCQAAMCQNSLKNEHELQSHFIRRIEAYLNQKGRRLIGWDEILEGGLAPNASVMSWRGMQGGIQAVKEGHDVVMSPTDFCYLDHYQSEDTDLEPPAIGGFLPLEKVYTFEPIPPRISLQEVPHILGIQGNLWTEYISTPQHAEYMLFPRLTALAEIAWSPMATPEGRDFLDFQRRMEAFLPHLKKLGANYRNRS